MTRFKLEGCIYQLTVNNRPYIGQSRVLDENKMPTKRWKRHIAESKCSSPKLHLYRAIKTSKVSFDTLDKKVLEYIEQSFDCESDILTNLVTKKDKLQFEKYIKIVVSLLENDDINVEEISDYIETEEDLTEEEMRIINQIDSFIKKINEAEEKWVKLTNSMAPEKGGNGYNYAPPGGALLHEPHTEKHKKYMSNLMSGRKLSDETKDLLRKARIGKPLSSQQKDSIAKTANNKFVNEIFPRRYNEWVIQYNKLGHSPDSNSNDIDERRAGQWRQDMISKKKCNGFRIGLTDEQIEKLSNTPGWLWEQPDEFMIQFENYKKQYILYKGKLNTSKRDPTNPNKQTAVNWIRRIRGMKKNNDPYLTEERLNLLNSCEFWSWKSTTFITFDDNILNWVEFYEKNKRVPTMGSNDEDEKKLARWQTRTRMDYHKQHKRLTKKKIDMLESLNGWVWEGR